MKQIVLKIIEILSDHIELIMIILGLATILIAAFGRIPYLEVLPEMRPSWRIFTAVVGILVIITGLVALWFDISRVNGPVGPDGEVLETIKCEGTLVDSYLGNSEKVVDMPEERRWTYELEDVLIKIYPNELSLEYNALIKSPHSKSTEVYRSYGSGPFIGGVAHIIYSYEKMETGSPSWKGAMVLRVPQRGLISGYWLTTDVNRDDKFPMGTITLKRQT
jgi:hypothetical protein